jgi:hypothetical protein
MSTIVYNMIDGTFIDRPEAEPIGMDLSDTRLQVRLAVQEVCEAETSAERLYPMPPELMRISVSQFLTLQP